MTKLYAASEDEKSAEAADSDEELLRADEVSGSEVSLSLGRLLQPVACAAAISGWYSIVSTTSVYRFRSDRPTRWLQPARRAPAAV
jgi:hypothetical protein